jgi:hypothetical protein
VVVERAGVVRLVVDTARAMGEEKTEAVGAMAKVARRRRRGAPGVALRVAPIACHQ